MPQPTFYLENNAPKIRDSSAKLEKKILGRQQENIAGAAANNPRLKDSHRRTVVKIDPALVP